MSKGTDEDQGPDEEVTSSSKRLPSDMSPYRNLIDTCFLGQSGLASRENNTAQETFFRNAGISKDEKAAPSKFANEVTDKDPFESSGPDSGNNATKDTSREAAPPISSGTTETTSGSGLDKVGSTAPDKNYRTADTEPHPQSSEVLSSATPGAALDSSYGSSGPRSQTTGSGYDQSSTTTGSGGYDSTPATTTDYPTGSGYDKSSTTTGTTGYDNPSTTTAPAADTDYPSPKTQPTESQGGLSGIEHNTGSAPSAPDTGNPEAMDDLSLGASQGQGKKKMGDRIKEKLHIGKKES